MIKKPLLISFVLITTGCGASMQAKDCATTDWNQKGYEDAMQGKTNETFEEYKNICSANPPNAAEYVTGYKRATTEYCTESNGYDRGIKGGKYHLSCAQDSEYYHAYVKALKKHSEERERKQLERLTRHGGDVTDSRAAPGGSPGM
ncbi:hypothetical protein Sde_1368 [Saccharophagus degradans 2-40]|uniref:Lipoprotein n=2 Tax=Saccharophagus degradans TaxID=86304 RepID=Q21KZ9_SACD2|nr:hypothetical protein Sde_1368 [Saccharophagus degradans 2-40]